MPGIEQTCSASIEDLTAQLASELRPRLGVLDALFAPTLIVVPNATIQTYLQQELSRLLGVTPNLEFQLIRSFLRDRLPDTGEWAPENRRIIGLEELHHILVALLLDTDEPWLRALPQLHDYLTAVADPTARQRRAFQLAGELSRLFMEYSFSRYETIITRWRKLGADGPRHLDGVERWQQALWWKIFGSPVQNLPKLLTLPDAFHEVSPADLRVPGAFHLFGFAYLARHFVEAIDLISRRSRVHLYTLRPTTDDPDETRLLDLWATASRDHTRQWQQLETPPTNAPLSTRHDHDTFLPRELHLLNAASIPREVESIAEEIWTVLHHHDTRGEPAPTVAVLIAGADQHAYQAHIEAVFSRTPTWTSPTWASPRTRWPWPPSSPSPAPARPTPPWRISSSPSLMIPRRAPRSAAPSSHSA